MDLAVDGSNGPVVVCIAAITFLEQRRHFSKFPKRREGAQCKRLIE